VTPAPDQQRADLGLPDRAKRITPSTSVSTAAPAFGHSRAKSLDQGVGLLYQVGKDHGAERTRSDRPDFDDPHTARRAQ
jgi:hypothetical protein